MPLACPFFVPREILTDGGWSHPTRLPLGAGWRGSCCAGGHEFTPDDETIHAFCNLGYAAGCPHLPADRDWDAIRFSVARTSVDQVTLHYVCESAHAPAEHGKLTFDLVRALWLKPHPDPRVHRLANCYVETFRSRQSVLHIE
jgi:hypothetical protein